MSDEPTLKEMLDLSDDDTDSLLRSALECHQEGQLDEAERQRAQALDASRAQIAGLETRIDEAAARREEIDQALEVSRVRACDYAQLEDTLRPETRVLIAESPTNPHLRVADVPRVAKIAEEHGGDNVEIQARMRSIKELAIQIVNLSPNLPSEAAYAIQNIESPTFLIHFIASNLQVEVADKQKLLETISLIERADQVMDHLDHEIQVLQLSEEIRSRVKTDVDRQQREYLLRQQMKAIQDRPTNSPQQAPVNSNGILRRDRGGSRCWSRKQISVPPAPKSSRFSSHRPMKADRIITSSGSCMSSKGASNIS